MSFVRSGRAGLDLEHPRCSQWPASFIEQKIAGQVSFSTTIARAFQGIFEQRRRIDIIFADQGTGTSPGLPETDHGATFPAQQFIVGDYEILLRPLASYAPALVQLAIRGRYEVDNYVRPLPRILLPVLRVL